MEYLENTNKKTLVFIYFTKGKGGAMVAPGAILVGSVLLAGSIITLAVGVSDEISLAPLPTICKL